MDALIALPRTGVYKAMILIMVEGLFGVPTALSMITADSFARRFVGEIARDVVLDLPVIDRGSIDMASAWIS